MAPEAQQPRVETENHPGRPRVDMEAPVAASVSPAPQQTTNRIFPSIPITQEEDDYNDEHNNNNEHDDQDKGGIANRTRSATRRTITQETAFAALKLEMLNAVLLIKETGQMMEYRHLIADPKFRDIWRRAFGKEIGCNLINIINVCAMLSMLFDVPPSKYPALS